MNSHDYGDENIGLCPECYEDHYHRCVRCDCLLHLKASKKHKLSMEEKQYNHTISKKRIYVEHVNRYLKRFRILSSRYRNKRRSFGLRVSLICGIYNFQL